MLKIFSRRLWINIAASCSIYMSVLFFLFLIDKQISGLKVFIKILFKIVMFKIILKFTIFLFLIYFKNLIVLP